MKITNKQVDVIERLTELALRVSLFAFVLVGVAVLTAFFIYCVMNNKGTQAKAITGYGDALFFTAFAKLVWNFFVRDKPGKQDKAISPGPALSKDNSLN